MSVMFAGSTKPSVPLISAHMSTGAHEKAITSKPPEVSSIILGMPTPSMPDIMESVVTVNMTRPKMNMLMAVRPFALRGYETAVLSTALYPPLTRSSLVRTATMGSELNITTMSKEVTMNTPDRTNISMFPI